MRPHSLILLACLALAPIGALAQDSSDTSPPPGLSAGPSAGLSAGPSPENVVTDPLAPRSAEGLTLEEFLWVARPVVVFADTPADPRFIEQMNLLTQRQDALLERDVVIIFDTDPSARSAIRTALRPRGFSVVILTKDGTVGMRRPAPRDVREIVRAIDNFQLRQEEVRRGE